MLGGVALQAQAQNVTQFIIARGMSEWEWIMRVAWTLFVIDVPSFLV